MVPPVCKKYPAKPSLQQILREWIHIPRISVKTYIVSITKLKVTCSRTLWSGFRLSFVPTYKLGAQWAIRQVNLIIPIITIIPSSAHLGWVSEELSAEVCVTLIMPDRVWRGGKDVRACYFFAVSTLIGNIATRSPTFSEMISHNFSLDSNQHFTCL